ncbi:armadillo-type protein [Glomus cerebriforme]|uniref:Armadillo-type protein n=1 Tax=Glomus cerebriforme TaxID=658196 RepID=A0A397TAA4_9GLOM|nr:armadillo-type protein [Glomus cerebriforme]
MDNNQFSSSHLRNDSLSQNELLDGFLLVRPVWVDDETVKNCKSCEIGFTTLRRKHHCRQCGNIFCQDCTSRKISLPQFGYIKPERICNECFEIAYLVGYIISDEQSTRIHGARGLLDIVERGNEHELSNFITYGGLDALVYLCRTLHTNDLHQLGTTALTNLSGYESFKPYIIMKGGLPYLYNLILFYYKKISSDTDSSNTAKFLDSASTIILNIGNILYSLSISGSLCQRMLTDVGSLEAIMKLASFQLGSLADDEASDEDILLTYEEMQLRVEIARGLAAKTISCLATNPSHQLLIFENPSIGLDRLMELLHSNTYEVRKYAAKSIAYLSLRNDKYKSALIKNGRVELLTSVIELVDENLAKANQVTISHACCAMANLATNAESQQLLISQPSLLSNLCQVVSYFISDKEIQRHVARLLANFALYEENKTRMLFYPMAVMPNEEEEVEKVEQNNNNQQLEESFGSIVPTLIAIGDSPVADVEIQRHIVRALDNLSTEVLSMSHSKLLPCLPLIKRILDTIKDEDIRKRASHVLNKLSPPLPSIPISSPFVLNNDQQNYFQQDYDDDISHFYGQPQNTSDLSLNEKNNLTSKDTKVKVEDNTIMKTDDATTMIKKVDSNSNVISLIPIENLIYFDDTAYLNSNINNNNYENIEELNNNFNNISLEHNYNNEETLNNNNNSIAPQLPPLRQNSGTLPALLNQFPFNN